MTRRRISTRERVDIFHRNDEKGQHMFPDDVMLPRILEKSIPEPNSGCWIWTGASKAKGYGHIWNGKAYEGAHRVSYRIHCGPIPDGHVVCHRCDNPSCVNPGHLWAGTTSQNIADCISKGRLRPGRFPGEKHREAILTEDAVREIRSDPGLYGYRKRLAVKFGVSDSTIGKVRGRESWKHVP